MNSIQIIQNSEDFKNEVAQKVAKILLPDLVKNFKPKEPETYLTRQEVADIFKIDLSTVYNWTKRGRLKAYGIGQRVYYKRSEVFNALVSIND